MLVPYIDLLKSLKIDAGITGNFAGSALVPKRVLLVLRHFFSVVLGLIASDQFQRLLAVTSKSSESTAKNSNFSI